ncbi:MAG: DUF2264 domain-containing protein [Pyrinomonadaceae bacterium]
MFRRNFLKGASLFGLAGFVSGKEVLAAGGERGMAIGDREYWVKLLDKIASPVVGNMSNGQLVKNMPMLVSPIYDNRDRRVAYMEAFGRLIVGLAPFLALPDDNSAEGKVRKRLREQTLQSFVHGFDPQSADYFYWGSPTSRQPLVDAAFIAQALLMAPETLWKPLDEKTKGRVIKEFKTIRQIKPHDNNWVLFAAIIESFLLSVGEEIDASRIDPAIERIVKWYVGDGWYKDGETFHFDHYNGFVIQPMLVDVLKANVANGRRNKKEHDLAYKRMQRYGEIQERLISPEGTFPVVGRSATYRVGAFLPLAKLALDKTLPADVTPAQVRCALTAVFKNVFVPSTFTKDGWLTIGFVGDKQQAIADSYSNIGSMYLTSFAFLPLGLPATDDFWSAPPADWTQRKAWSGKPIKRDHAADF